jgi:tetratricopeptide (TPR) repeat protein
MIVAGWAVLPAQNPPTQDRPAENPPAQNLLPPPAQEKKPAPLSDEEMGDLHMARKEYADAVDYYLRALREIGGQRARTWNKIGIAYQQQMDFKNARKAYKRAIQLDKTFAPPWNNLGASYYLARKAKKSLKYYRQAIQLNPQSASFHLNLGTAYYETKKIPESLAEYRQALVLDPNILVENSRNATVVQTRVADAKFFYYLAKVYASVDRPDEAIRSLERAMEAGFQDREKIINDPDLKKLSNLPAFIELMKNPPVAIK